MTAAPAPLVRLDLADLRWPGRFAAAVLARGTPAYAFGAIAVAMTFSTVAAYRFAATTRFEDVVFGPARSEVIDALLASFGVERTAVIVYLMQRSFDAVIVASALTPLFIWLLGSSAVHAAARIRGVRGRAYLPTVVLFAYAELVYQVPTSMAAILFGGGRGPGAALSTAIGIVMFVWLAAVVYRGIELHYGARGDSALAIFLIAALLFYLLPGLLIVAAFVAIVVVAAILDYF